MSDDVFAIRLLRAQTNAGMTASELARATEMAKQKISDYQAGISEPRLASLVKLAKALNVSTDYLCCMNPEPGSSDEINK